LNQSATFSPHIGDFMNNQNVHVHSGISMEVHGNSHGKSMEEGELAGKPHPDGDVVDAILEVQWRIALDSASDGREDST